MVVVPSWDLTAHMPSRGEHNKVLIPAPQIKALCHVPLSRKVVPFDVGAQLVERVIQWPKGYGFESWLWIVGGAVWRTLATTLLSVCPFTFSVSGWCTKAHACLTSTHKVYITLVTFWSITLCNVN